MFSAVVECYAWFISAFGVKHFVVLNGQTELNLEGCHSVVKSALEPSAETDAHTRLPRKGRKTQGD